VTSRTRSAIRQRFYRELDDQQERLVVPALLNDWINDAIDHLNERGVCGQAKVAVAVGDAVTSVLLPATVGEILYATDPSGAEFHVRDVKMVQADQDGHTYNVYSTVRLCGRSADGYLYFSPAISTAGDVTLICELNIRRLEEAAYPDGLGGSTFNDETTELDSHVPVQPLLDLILERGWVRKEGEGRRSGWHARQAERGILLARGKRNKLVGANAAVPAHFD